MRKFLSASALSLLLFCASLTPVSGESRTMTSIDYGTHIAWVELNSATKIYSQGNSYWYRGESASISAKVTYILSLLGIGPTGLYDAKFYAYDRNGRIIAAFTAESHYQDNFVSPRDAAKITILFERYKAIYERKWFLFIPYDKRVGRELIETRTSTAYINQDTEGPELFVSGGNRILNTSSAKVSVSGYDAGSGIKQDSWRYRADSGPEISGREVTVSGEGIHQITFYAQDNLGNEGSVTTQIIIDTTKPVITGAEGVPHGWTNKDVTIRAGAHDALAGIDPAAWRFSTDGGIVWSGEGPANNTVTLRENGIYNVRFTVKDLAGNISDFSGVYQVKIDKTLPVITLTGSMGEQEWSKELSRTIRAVVTDSFSGLKLLESAKPEGEWTSEPEAAPAAVEFTGEGTFVWQLRAGDEAGNTALASARVNLDRHNPLISGFGVSSPWIRPDHQFHGLRLIDSTEASRQVSGIDQGSVTVMQSGGTAVPVNRVCL